MKAPLKQTHIYSKFAKIIGIDSGVNTGIAVWNNRTKKLERVESVMIHEALSIVQNIHNDCIISEILVRVEDARQVKFNTDKVKLQGAGSIKRDAKIWEDFLNDKGIPFEMVRPNKASTKIKAELFEKITGWEGRTNSHSRDATMMVFGK